MIDIDYRTLSRKGKCCICGKTIEAKKEKVFHCYNQKSNGGTVTICNDCLDEMVKIRDGISNNRLKRKWEPVVDAYGELKEFICDCGRSVLEATAYCPQCGSEMDSSDLPERIQMAIYNAMK